jgi:hypothetical protein
MKRSYRGLTKCSFHCAVRTWLFVALPPVRRSASEISAKKDHPRFIIADVFCPQIFNLLCVRDGIRHAPAVDPIGAVEESGRGQFQAETLKLGDEGVNVKFGHRGNVLHSDKNMLGAL